MLFIGVGYQQKKEHHIISVMGEHAQTFISEAYELIKENLQDIKCTRLDFEMTLETPIPVHIEPEPDELIEYNHHLYEEAYDAQIKYELTRGIRKRKVTLFKSSDGTNTLYIGSRQSSAFTRIYQMLVSDSGWYTRYEVEFKDHQANSNFHSLFTASHFTKQHQAIFEKQIYEIHGNYDLLKPILTYFEALRGDDSLNVSNPFEQTSLNLKDTLDWFKRSIPSSFKRLLAEPSTRQQVIDLITQLYQEVQEYKK